LQGDGVVAERQHQGRRTRVYAPHNEELTTED
jgi:hypothetical protein